MRNLKKLLAVIVAICVLATFTVPAFAAETTKTDAEICEDLGVLKGAADGVTDAYLADGTTRIQAAILCLRLLGLEDEAKAETSTENFEDAAAMTWTEGKTILAYLKKHPELGWQGDNINFGAQNPATAQMLYKAILTALGYKQGVDFEYADAITFAGEKGLTAIASVTELTNNDVAKALVESLKAKVADGSQTLVEKLVADGTITAAAAEAAGLIATAVALDVKTAVALNSKVVEVTLATAATEKDLTGVTVKDSAAKDIAVSKIEFAPWATDGKTVLVTLAAETAAGTYYTLTAGTKSVNFGGKATDTVKPEIDGAIAVEDYNEIRINFTEAVLLGGTVEVTALYGDKAVLETSNIAYVDKDTIKVTTAAQSESTLYGIKIKGFTDLAANTMADSTDKTFVGIPKPTAKNTIKDTVAKDSKTIEVTFDVKIDATTTLDASKYTVTEAYGSKTAIAVASVEAKADTKDTVVVKLNEDTKGATLYELKIAAGITTLYGVATTDALTDTFVGEPKDETKIEKITAASVSNTKVDITAGTSDIKDAFDAATTKEMFSIKEAYGDNAVLAISEIKISKNVATLTVAAQTGVLYEVKMLKGVKDAAGNATTDDLTTTFVGQAVAAKISAIDSITRNSETTITVNFNQNVGDTATDVAHYTIDGDVGYPQKAETTANKDEVKLTIPKTKNSTLYTLTVKGLENADGVAMDAAGVTAKFSGSGIDAGEPKVDGVVAIDAQTLRVFFDRSVDDATIKGAAKLWNGNALITGAFLYNDAGSATQDLVGAYAYKDSSNANALIIRVSDTAAFNSSNFATGAAMFTLTVDANKVSNTVGLPFANNNNAPANPYVKGIIANNKNTLTVYFSEDVSGVEAGDFTIAPNADGSGTNILVSAVVKVDAKTYQLKTDNMATQAYYLRIVETGNDDDKTIINIMDLTGLVEMKSTNDSTAVADYAAYQFAGSAADVGSIKTVPIVMTDARTMVVHYPEAMNTTAAGAASVLDPANYDIVKLDGTTKLIEDNEVTQIKWSAANNTATLTFKNDVDTSDTGYYVVFATTLENALGTKYVINGTAAVKQQFAKSTADAAKVAISSVTYSAKAITIKLNQGAKTTGNIVTTTPFALTLQYFGIDTKIAAGVTDAIDGTTNEIDSVVAKLGSDSVADTSAGYFDTIVITLTTAQDTEMVDGEVATVSLKNAAAYTGYNGMAGNADSKAVFIQ